MIYFYNNDFFLSFFGLIDILATNVIERGRNINELPRWCFFTLNELNKQLSTAQQFKPLRKKERLYTTAQFGCLKTKTSLCLPENSNR